MTCITLLGRAQFLVDNMKHIMGGVCRVKSPAQKPFLLGEGVVRQVLALLTVVASSVAVAGLDNPAADMDPFEGNGDVLSTLFLLAILGGALRAWSKGELGPVLADIVRGLAWLAGIYLWVFAFGACVFAWLYVLRSFIDSKGFSAFLALVCGAVTWWRIFSYLVERPSKR